MGENTDTMGAGDRPTSFSIGEAARVLGVSIRTVRRWEADGRLTAVRTDGGHRRFPVDAVMALRDTREQEDGGGVPNLRRAGLPTKSLPVLERVLVGRADAIFAVTVGHMYNADRPGWFRSAAAAPHLKAFISQLTAAARTGDWHVLPSATSLLITRAAAADQGPTYQEAFQFLRTLRAVLIRELRAYDPQAPLELSQLFEVIEQEAGHNAELFFQSTAPPSESSPEVVFARPSQSIPGPALEATRKACTTLATISTCAGALVLAGGISQSRLEVIGAAGVEIEGEGFFSLADDPFSEAVADGSTSFINSTRVLSRLPVGASAARCLPVVASTVVPDQLRVATVLLIRPGVDVDTSVLVPLADLNGRLAAVLGGSEGDADTRNELGRIGEHLH
jgi:excisionase family DNA binding protein